MQGEKRIAYLTDVEGRWDKLQSFATGNPHVSLQGDQLQLADGVQFVFGGDSVDRGTGGRRVLHALLDAKARYADRVVLLAGNRDINKLRMLRELHGKPPLPAPDELKEARGAGLLKWILKWSMGAGDTFELRRAELHTLGLGTSDKEVHDSFLEDISEGGLLRRFLAQAQLAYRSGNTLFVHGAVGRESLGHVPGVDGAPRPLDQWISELNAWYLDQVTSKDNGADRPPWQDVIRYQAPRGFTKTNPGSVVYGRLSDEHGNPQLPEDEVMKSLREDGVRRLVVGHTPCGDSPAYISDGEFEVVLADNSYGRLEYGSQVLIEPDLVTVRSQVSLDDGSVHDVGFSTSRLDAQPLGMRDVQDSFLMKGRLADGRYLAAKLSPGYKLEQLALDDATLRQKRFAHASRRPVSHD